MLINRVITAGSRRWIQARAPFTTRLSSSVTPKEPELTPNTNNLDRHRTSSFDRWILVFAGKYRRGGAPEFVSQAVMEKARSVSKIKGNLYFAVFTILGMLVGTYIGKQERAAGYSVAQMNLDWHKDVNRQDEEESKRTAQK
ncbi:uncharacterized protein LOC100904819 [Galendromus occidentalis]|uniref:Uncharacterized protein LOC100904819 n=1 Tax=Galendromus occidentalis TaxID=34638 RepID=A0AAJ6QWF8_9ACAR|nr:uncharacterized protein LOC100904819 [Galendromus occidentalis]